MQERTTNGHELKMDLREEAEMAKEKLFARTAKTDTVGQTNAFVCDVATNQYGYANMGDKNIHRSHSLCMLAKSNFGILDEFDSARPRGPIYFLAFYPG